MNKKQKIYLVVLMLGCMLLCSCKKQEEILLLQPGESTETVEIPAETAAPTRIAVYVCGQVKTPGVVYLPEDARAVDAVEAAGGLTENADAEYVNLAAYVTDGEKLYIPDRQEGEALRIQEEALLSGMVNINTADLESLMTLPGIGESRAQAILDYRREHGNFSAKEDLMKISGIKESLFEKIEDKIIVE